MRIISSGAEAKTINQQLEKKITERESSLPRSYSANTSFRDATVNISGSALVRQRLSGLIEAQDDAYAQGNNKLSIPTSYASFLNRDDKAFLGKVYDWAKGNGVDLQYVDNLGAELASYRKHDEGKAIGRLNQENRYDMEGHRVSYSFTDKDAATAKRILGSEALSTATLDHGFVKYITDKDYGSRFHNDFDFMEAVINKFSAKNLDHSGLSSRFASYEVQENNYVRTLSTEKYTPGEGDILEKSAPGQNARKPKEITLESLRDDMRKSFLKAMGVENFSSLFDVLFKDKR